jgi:hypothetical protein
MRTGAKAVAYARTITRWPVGYCLKYVRTCFGISGKYPSAISAWNNAKHRHGPSSAVPPGVPVFFRGGRYGHVAISVGNGKCRSTDYPRRGVVSEVAISTLAKNWNYPYLGWTEDLNGVRIYSKPAAAKPVAKPASTITPLSSSTKMNKTGWQVSDLRHVLHKAGYLETKYNTSSDAYDINVQRGVSRFHKAHPRYSSAPTGQIGPKGWAYLQTLAGRK